MVNANYLRKRNEIKFKQEKIKNLSNKSAELGYQATPRAAGGQVDTWGNCSFGCDTAVYLGCPSINNCYSAKNEICMM